MSNSHRNFILSYIALVLLPILFLVVVLRAGRVLVAPISTNGSWKVDSDVPGLAAGSCNNLSEFAANSSFVISQSGRNLRLALSGSRSTGVVAAGTTADGMIAAGIVADGTLTGKILKISIAPRTGTSASPNCAAGQPLTLVAEVDTSSEPRSLRGSISVDGCASCPSTAFHAVRVPRTALEGVR